MGGKSVICIIKGCGCNGFHEDETIQPGNRVIMIIRRSFIKIVETVNRKH